MKYRITKTEPGDTYQQDFKVLFKPKWWPFWCLCTDPIFIQPLRGGAACRYSKAFPNAGIASQVLARLMAQHTPRDKRETTVVIEETT